MKSRHTHTFLFGVLIAVLAIAPAASGEIILFTADTTYQPPASSLYALDPATGTATPIGDCQVDGYVAGLGYDPTNDILYGTTTRSDNLYSIDYSTGKANLIGSLGVTLMHALAYDDSSGKLYGAYGYHNGDGFYEIDVSTGAATLVGNTGFFHPDHGNTVVGLAVHPQTHALYASVAGPAFDWGAFIEIDKSTGQGTLVSKWTEHIEGLAFNPETHMLYGVDNWSGNLYTIDIITGTPTLVGTTGLGNPLGLEFVPEPATIFLLGLGGAIFLRRRRI